MNSFGNSVSRTVKLLRRPRVSHTIQVVAAFGVLSVVVFSKSIFAHSSFRLNGQIECSDTGPADIMMTLVESSSTAAISYLRRDPIGNVFPIYAALRSHASTVGLLAVGPKGEARGVLVDASLSSSETVRDIYIDSAHDNVVVELFKTAQPCVVKKVKQGVYVPSSLLTSEESCFGRCQLSKERIYRLERPIPVSHSTPPIREVTAEYLATLVISSAFDKYLGNPINLPSEGRSMDLCKTAFCWQSPNALLIPARSRPSNKSLCHRCVDANIWEHRLSHELCNLLVSEGKTVVYRVEEKNLPSVRLAESLGFTLHLSLGYVL